MKKIEKKDHTADISFKVSSDSLEGFFLAAAEGITAALSGKTQFSAEKCRMTLEITGDSSEELLVKFLNELIFLFYHKALFPNFDGSADIQIDKNVLRVTAGFSGVESFDSGAEIKAVTYGNLKINFDGIIYSATVIADA